MLLWGRKKNNSSLQYQFDYKWQLQSCFGGCLHADNDNNYVKSRANQSHIIGLITHYLHAHIYQRSNIAFTVLQRNLCSI
jgi:hypothetical protein